MCSALGAFVVLAYADRLNSNRQTTKIKAVPAVDRLRHECVSWTTGLTNADEVFVPPIPSRMFVAQTRWYGLAVEWQHPSTRLAPIKGCL